VERSAASNTLTALGGGFGQAIARGEDRTNHRRANDATPANACSHFRRLPVCPGVGLVTLRRQPLIRPMIFSPARLRSFIEQGLILVCCTGASEGRAGRMLGKLARGRQRNGRLRGRRGNGGADRVTAQPPFPTQDAVIFNEPGRRARGTRGDGGDSCAGGSAERTPAHEAALHITALVSGTGQQGGRPDAQLASIVASAVPSCPPRTQRHLHGASSS